MEKVNNHLFVLNKLKMDNYQHVQTQYEQKYHVSSEEMLRSMRQRNGGFPKASPWYCATLGHSAYMMDTLFKSYNNGEIKSPLEKYNDRWKKVILNEKYGDNRLQYLFSFDEEEHRFLETLSFFRLAKEKAGKYSLFFTQKSMIYEIKITLSVWYFNSSIYFTKFADIYAQDSKKIFSASQIDLLQNYIEEVFGAGFFEDLAEHFV